MIIFSSKNTVITTENSYFISQGNAVNLDAPEYICATFPFDALSETAVITGEKMQKTDGIYTIDYLGETALAIVPRRIYPSFLLLAQKSDFNLTATVYGDFTLKITIEFMQNAKIFTLPFYSREAQIYIRYIGNNKVVAVHFTDVGKVALYLCKSDDIILLDVISADEVSLVEEIILTKTHPTMLCHKTVITYKIEHDKLKEVNKKIYRKDNDLFSIKEDLIGVAFLEEVFLRANYADFLSPKLKEKQHLILDYFGDVKKVITINNPLTNCAVVYKNSSNYDYTVKPVEIVVQDNKVVNFKIID